MYILCFYNTSSWIGVRNYDSRDLGRTRTGKCIRKFRNWPLGMLGLLRTSLNAAWAIKNMSQVIKVIKVIKHLLVTWSNPLYANNCFLLRQQIKRASSNKYTKTRQIYVISQQSCCNCIFNHSIVLFLMFKHAKIYS